MKFISTLIIVFILTGCQDDSLTQFETESNQNTSYRLEPVSCDSLRIFIKYLGFTKHPLPTYWYNKKYSVRYPASQHIFYLIISGEKEMALARFNFFKDKHIQFLDKAVSWNQKRKQLTQHILPRWEANHCNSKLGPELGPALEKTNEFVDKFLLLSYAYLDDLEFGEVYSESSVDSFSVANPAIVKMARAK